MEMKKWTSKGIEIQLNFTEPLAVSQGVDLDILNIKIKEKARFLFTSINS